MRSPLPTHIFFIGRAVSPSPTRRRGRKGIGAERIGRRYPVTGVGARWKGLEEAVKAVQFQSRTDKRRGRYGDKREPTGTNGAAVFFRRSINGRRIAKLTAVTRLGNSSNLRNLAARSNVCAHSASMPYDGSSIPPGSKRDRPILFRFFSFF